MSLELLSPFVSTMPIFASIKCNNNMPAFNMTPLGVLFEGDIKLITAGYRPFCARLGCVRLALFRNKKAKVYI